MPFIIDICSLFVDMLDWKPSQDGKFNSVLKEINRLRPYIDDMNTMKMVSKVSILSNSLSFIVFRQNERNLSCFASELFTKSFRKFN